MRMYPSRYITPEKPVVVKKTRAELQHFSPPVKGLAEAAQSAETDPKFAGILVNLYPDVDRLTVRAGFRKVCTIAGGTPIEHLIPYYGEPRRIIAASNHGLYDASTGVLAKSGFTSNNWHWTAFSDLGATERVIMVNGNDGVFSWDGLTTANVGPVAIVRIDKNTVSPYYASVTVAAADIGKFKNYDDIVISGADAGHANANGPQLIWKVGDKANSFELYGVDTSGWGGDQTTGTITAIVQGSFAQEAVKPPKGNTWLQVNDLSIVVAHQNRLFFADEANLAIYYLPLQQRYGELSVLPLNAIFKKGGTIRAMNTWTVAAGGTSMRDSLVIFTSNGEAAIYSGVDPDSDFSLEGVFRYDAPLSKWCTANYGGELYTLIPTGLTPMSAVLKSGREGVEAADRNVTNIFLRNSINYRANAGWEIFLNPNSGRMFCNIPVGGNVYRQMVRGMANPAWCEFRNVPARCWSWQDPYVYHADDFGNVYEMHPAIQSDDGKPIYIDVQMAWSQFKTPAIKHFKMVLPYIITDGYPTPAIDVKVDFDSTPPQNVPDITVAAPGQATWNVTAWNSKPWVSGTRNWSNWTGVGSMGRVGAIRMTAAVFNCSFQCTGWDVMFDRGSVFG